MARTPRDSDDRLRVTVDGFDDIPDLITIPKPILLLTYAIVEMILPDSKLHSAWAEVIEKSVPVSESISKIKSFYDGMMQDESMGSLYQTIGLQIAEFQKIMRSDKVKTDSDGRAVVDQDLMDNVLKMPKSVREFLELKTMIASDVSREKSTLQAVEDAIRDANSKSKMVSESSALEQVVSGAYSNRRKEREKSSIERDF